MPSALMDFTAPAVDYLIVGEERVRWSIQRQYLKKSPYLSQLLIDDGSDGISKTFELPYTETFSFRRYLHYLVHDSLPIENFSHGTKQFYLARLYVLGESFGDAGLANTVFRQLYDLLTEAKYEIHYHTVTRIYRGTAKDSLGRQLLADVFYARSTSAWLCMEEGTVYPREFLLDILIRKMEENEGLTQSILPLERYYEQEGEKRAETMTKAKKRKREREPYEKDDTICGVCGDELDVPGVGICEDCGVAESG